VVAASPARPTCPELASAMAGTTAGNIGQTKTLTTSAFAATLDLVAATWTKAT
jgi:hypothetical protein